MSDFPFGQSVAWEPDPVAIEASRMRAFMQKQGVPDLDALQRRSIEDPVWFWDAVLQDLGIRFRTPYESVLENASSPRPSWCVGGQMNIVDTLIDQWIARGLGDRVALVAERENGQVDRLTYAQLADQVDRCAAGLRSLGLGRGDAMGLLMPMSTEILIAFLAVIKIGGVILPLFSGYGPEAIATRLRDASAKVLFTCDGFVRRGAAIQLKPVADEALKSVPSVQHVIVASRNDVPQSGQIEDRDLAWSELMGRGSDSRTEVMDAEDVLMIIYTSGTTGRPKGAVHTHCGFPVKAAQDMAHAMDVKEGDIVYWMSDMGWMMGPWLVFGTLALGATMVFYDGAPDRPGPDRVWSLVEDHRITHLGLSPVLIRALMPHGTDAVDAHDVTSLRAAMSTGSPWDPESWSWLFQNVLKETRPILNYSGGTEISGGILCGNLFRPLKPGSFSGPVPGMGADVVGEDGAPLRGAVGELVIRGPWIGMTRGFWNDDERYLDSYWRRFPGLWTHGDFAAIDEDGLWYILGRSDDTIKVAGKRLGPAEAEAIVNGHTAIRESAAIGVPDPLKGEALVLFCVAEGEPSDALRDELRNLVASALGKPLKPREIRFTRSLPKTRNAKVMRRLIRAVYLQGDIGDISSLEDPATLDDIREAT